MSRGWSESSFANAQAFAALGAALVLRGDLDAGVQQLEHAVELSPKDPSYAPWSTMLSFATALLGDQERSLHWAKSACQSDARYFPSRIAHARALAQQGAVDEAKAALSEARRLFPDLDRAYVSEFAGKWVAEQFDQVGLHLG